MLSLLLDHPIFGQVGEVIGPGSIMLRGPVDFDTRTFFGFLLTLPDLETRILS